MHDQQKSSLSIYIASYTKLKVIVGSSINHFKFVNMEPASQILPQYSFSEIFNKGNKVTITQIFHRLYS